MSQQTSLSSAPDSPALLVSANVQKYAIKKKKVLTAEEAELFELTQSAGVVIDQEVFKIIVDLLKMNVAPQAVFQTLKAMCAGQRVAECGTEPSSAAHTASAPAAPTEAREEETTLASGKGPKAAAAASAASGAKATRVNAKIVVYGPQDVNSSHSQVRSKTGAGHSEKTRDASSQKVQRQPSTSRGQKTKSSGSSSSSSQINST